MTKAKQAIKEVNKMADKEIFKAKLEGYKKNAIEWLDTEVYGYKRGKILFITAIVVLAVISTFE
jgi:hypothetical protein